MPPRYSYWTIIAGGLATAFRAADRDELLPTFARIRHKHPDAEMKWFARGKLWDSPESARRDTEERRRDKRPAAAGGERGRAWRPGGEHRDPRQKYKDAKKAHNTRERKRKFERRERSAVQEDRPLDQREQYRSRGPQRKPTHTGKAGAPAARGIRKPRGPRR